MVKGGWILRLAVAAVAFALALTVSSFTAPVNAAGSEWVPVYDSAVANFSDWQTNHPDKFYWDASAGAYHYEITDAADDYAFVTVPYSCGSFRLEFDGLPVQTGWAGNFRLGLWDQQMRQETASSLYAHFHHDDNGYHAGLECYWPGGSAGVPPSNYSDGRWYHVAIEYSAEEAQAVFAVTSDTDGQISFGGTAPDLGEFAGLDRIAMTSIGDYGYPGRTAAGYIRNVRLFGSIQGAIKTVSVSATSPWSTDTGVCVAAGQQFTIEATGQWTSGLWTGGPGGQDGQLPTGSDWLLPGSRQYALIGKIGPSGAPFFIGTGGTFAASAGGNLILSMNDVPGIFWDNSGAVTASIVAEGILPPTGPPETEMLPGACGRTVCGGEPTVCWSGSDDTTPAGDLTYLWRVDGGEWQGPTADTCIALTALADDWHVFEVKARDAAGNEDPTPAQCSFILDASPPMISITSPAGGATVAGIVGIRFRFRDTSDSMCVEAYAGGRYLLGFCINPPGVVPPPETAPLQSETWHEEGVRWDSTKPSVQEGPAQICIRAWDFCGHFAEQCITVTVDNATFDDVPKTSPWWRCVEALAATGITSGCSVEPSLYCPYARVTRAQMAKFICLAAGKTWLERDTPTFADVPKSHPFYGWIERLTDAASWGGTPPAAGCEFVPTRKFCPGGAVTREYLAMVLCLATGKPQMPSYSGAFADVGRTNPFSRFIERLADADSWPGGVAVTSGCATNPPRYCPKDPVTRGQMAVFLVRAFGFHT